MTLRSSALALIAASVLTVPALAQPMPQDAASAAAPGQIDFTYNRSRPTAAPADKTPLQAKGVRLRDMILKVPALADPRGFALHASVVLDRPVASRAGDPDQVWGSLISRRINVTRGKPDAQGRYPGDGEGPALIYTINKPEAAFGFIDDAGLFELPQPRQARDGVLRFSRAGRDYVVITPPGVPAYLPAGDGSAKGRLNPALASGSGAATQARVITLGVLQRGRIGDDQERQRLLAAASQIDIAAVQALLRD
ncbi:MAG: hypothetical protein KKE02_00700 [Alphaproteobacteria bacterium]|nr:hypothetical protein [Alphaproteobacteria bacterium]MBU1515708.1 hypothetical protein [Alphaproteobacteria bacterium]MBU2096991.1 hypothetical protein [Alphaproteobacteria bacterium]MBU2149507.1 hypothetical protein [Alphaproteobacteria bacterium]MBU2308893.1 hypothetical protein [Alphaproteobacteria bacterium]